MPARGEASHVDVKNTDHSAVFSVLPYDKSKSVVTLDRTGVKRNASQYVAMFFWIGWIFFYLAFTLALPLLYTYAKGLLSAIVTLMAISAVYPIDRKKQPNVR